MNELINSHAAFIFNTLIYNFRKHQVRLDILFKQVYLFVYTVFGSIFN